MPGNISVWAEEDTIGAPLASPARGTTDLFEPATHTVNLLAAAGEVVSFRLSVAAAGAVDLRWSGFTAPGGGSIPAELDVYRCHRVSAGVWPGWYIRRLDRARRSVAIPDVLVPASAPQGGLPADLADGEVLELWVDVRVGRGSPPGDYTAALDVTVNGQTALAVPVTLTVWPFLLPEDPGLTLSADLDHQSLFRAQVRCGGRAHAPERILAVDPAAADLRAALRAAMELLAAHGVSAHPVGLHPVVKVDATEQVRVDWTDYDLVVEEYLRAAPASGPRGSPWPIPFDERLLPPPAAGPLHSPNYARLVRSYLTQAAAHFAQRGWLSHAYLRLPTGGRPAEEAAAWSEHFGYIARAADPRLRLLSRCFPQDLAAGGWDGYVPPRIDEYVDIWCPPAQFYDRRALQSDYGSTVWFAGDRPPFSGSAEVWAPAADTVVLPWQGLAAGAGNIELGLINAWPGETADPALPQQCVDRDARVLIYPGTPYGLPGPVPSARLKRLHRGLQDLAYLKLLEARGKGHIAALLVDSLVPVFGAESCRTHFADGDPQAWQQDPHWWILARRIMADELLSTVAGGPGADQHSVPTTIRWRQFMEGVRRTGLDIEGLRLRAAERGELDLECMVRITNRRRTPVEARVRLADLPVGWRVAPQDDVSVLLEPGRSYRANLRARIESLAWNDNGVGMLTVDLVPKDGPPQRTWARLCHLRPERMTATVRVDGDLREWPAGVGNYAGGFIPVSAGTSAHREGPLPVAAADTLGFVGFDEQNLYFGFRCAWPDGLQAATAVGNTVLCDDLVPRGGELVEVLIDPGNAGSRSPSDLFRLAMRTGGAWWERGVSMYPPVGVTGSWSAEVRHATRVHADCWTAEVAVPRAAFGEAGRQAGVWGIGFARFDAATQEYSTWSAPSDNAYDPAGLGNMTMP